MDCFSTSVDRSQIKKKDKMPYLCLFLFSSLVKNIQQKDYRSNIISSQNSKKRNFFLNILYFVTFEDAYKNEQKEKNNDDRKKRWKVERTGKDK